MTLDYPDDLKYLDTHEYVRLDADVAIIGITAFAVDQLGDIVFVELPEIGDGVEKGEKFGAIESVKAVEDLNSPVTGTVVDRNAPLLNAPEQIADDPYVEGWLIKVRMSEPDDLEDALSASEYQEQVEGE
jgi:glycine cleavage system H protein